jgi:exosortase
MSQVLEGAAVRPAKEPQLSTPSAIPLWQWLVIVAGTVYLYYDILLKLINDWYTDPNFSHGFLVPLFSAYVVWSKKEKLAAITPNPSLLGVVGILGGLSGLVVGILGSELFVARTSLIFLIAGYVVFFLGWSYFRAILFPWLFLFLMVPIPAIIFTQITFPLQLLASQLASFLLPIFGVPVLREGNVIQLPAMPLEVAEACSGIRSLMSLTTLAIVYGFFLETKTWPRVWLALSAIPIAVAANAFRIVGTGLMVQHWDPEKALGFFHEFSGWVIFIVSLGLLFAVHSGTRAFVNFLGNKKTA